MAPKEPAKIGKYDVVDVIGRGGMGVVYEATDPFLNRRVAIKMMTVGFANKPDLLKRFFREAQSTGSLQHPNIVTVFELGDHAGNPYLVMEFLEGESLDAIISSRRELSILEKIQAIIGVCHGLSHAHHRGIVHRDIKPANIMVTKEGTVKIVDFGIAHIGAAKETRTGQIMGSVSYMAPEQVNGSPVDARTDIFSTGVVLYELFTYNHPFDGENMAATLMKIIHAAPPPLSNSVSDLPPELEAIIFKALAKNREERYHSADDLAIDLSQLQAHLKQQIIGKHLQEVTELLENAELLKAKDQLLLALRVDRQNTEANLLLREVQQRIQKTQIKDQVQELRRQAEEALARRQFEPALRCLERAAGLDTTDVELQQLRESIQAAWSQELELQERLKRAESAHQAGDLDSAKQAMEEALQIAPEKVQAATLYRNIQHDLEARARQRQLDSYLEQAGREIAARKFTSALEKLKLAALVDPAAPQVKALIESATLGREQEQRRRDLEMITHQIEEALNRDDYVAACQKADEGLQRFPEERTLSKLKSLAEKQRHLAERKQFVDEQLNYARTLVEQGRNEELLSVLQSALEKTGPEPRLQSLLLIVRENVEHERGERRKAELLKKAKDALSRKSYDEAIEILESGYAELKDSSEIADLLQFAKDEALAEKRRLIVEAAAQEANKFIAEQEYEEAIKLLDATLQEAPDEELRLILVEVRRASLDYQKKLETTLTAAEKLLQSYKAGEALRMLESHSSLLARSSAFQNLLETARSEAERLRKIDEVMNRATQALEKEDYPTALELLEEGRRLHGLMPKLEQLLAEVSQKQSEAANKIVRKALGDAQILVSASQFQAALEKLALSSDFIRLVSPELKSEYESLRQQASEDLIGQRVAQFEQDLADGRFTLAESSLRQTLVLFPDNRDLRRLETVLREEVNRRLEAQRALTEGQTLLRQADWKQGGKFLKNAYAMAERAPAVREQVLASLLEAAEVAVKKDWLAAEVLLQQLAELQPSFIQPVDLQEHIAKRKRQELVDQCLGQATRLQAGGDLQAALREIERGLSSYVDESRLLDLRTQIQEQVRQDEERTALERARLEQEAFVRDVIQRSQSEPGLDRRIQILEESLVRYPGEPRLQHQLTQARDLSANLTAIVSEARALEDAKKYGEATARWNTVRGIYPQYPELDRQLGRVAKLAEQARTAEKWEWIRSTQAALASADYGRVADLLSLGKTKFPSAREVSEFEKKLQDGLKLREKAKKIIADGRAALGKKKWEKGAGYLARARESATHDPVVQELVIGELLEGCEAAIEVDCPSAEMLLAQVAEIQPNSPLLSPLKARIEKHKQEQTIEQHMTTAVRAQSSGDLQGALTHLNQGLAVYPNEPRLLQLKGSIENRVRQLEIEREAQQKAEKERARQAEVEQQRLAKQKRKEELEQERAKAAEQKEKLARARELEEKAEQERIRQREAEQQRQQERQQAEEQQTREKAEKKRQQEEQKLAEQTRRRIEALKDAEGGKTVVVVPSNVLTNPRVLVAGGAVLLAVVATLFWMLIPGAVPVEFKTTPLGTTVRIRSTGQECVTPYCSIKLRPGKHEMEFSHRGYTTETQTISVQAKGPNTFPIVLREMPPAVASTGKPPSVTNTAPPSTSAPPSTTKPPLIAMASMRIRGWNKGSEVFLDNNPIGTIGSAGTFSSITPGIHEIKVVDKKGESGKMQKSFASGERVNLAKKDFTVSVAIAASSSPPKPLPPLKAGEPDRWPQIANSGSTDQLEQYRAQNPNSPHLGELEATLDKLYWDKAMGAGSAVAFEEYLAKSPNGKHRDEAQENLTWRKTESTNTIQAFRDYQRQHPQGTHFESAGKKIEELRFQEARNSGDEATLQAFLKDYPSGTRHDQIFGRLDDMAWERTNKNDKGSLQAYVSGMPAGKHISQAQDAMEKLTEAAKPAKPTKPVVDDRAAVLAVVAQYSQAYNDRNVDALRKIWPTMDNKTLATTRDFFKLTNSVASSYRIDQGPQINGDEATVRVTLTLSYIMKMDGREQGPKPSSFSMTLKKREALGAGTVWQIQSVGK
jgi:eukaryotic-like serine/threonine-protein kinase